jgi:hypothetical protein
MGKVIDNLPMELVMLCYADIDPNSEEGKLLLPPDEIYGELADTLNTGDVSDLLRSWIEVQQDLAKEADQIVNALPPFDGTTMPGWMGQKWAQQLGCPWSAGLADAVREGKAWLASQ